MDLRHYHRIVTGSGDIRDGQFPITANAAGTRLRPGRYAAHTLHLNSGSIGLAMAAMHGARWRDPRGCAQFPTREQADALIGEAARLCRSHGIGITRATVLTHAEVETTLGVAQRQKWDFDYDPFGVDDSRDPIGIGDALRALIRGAAGEILPPAPDPADRPVLRRGSRGAAVADLQRLLGLPCDGIFGPRTRHAVIGMQRSRQLLADGVVGPMSWAALLDGR